MKNHENKISPLKLALIITASVVAAAAIVLIIVKIIKKKKAKAALECGCDCGCDGEWFDDDEDYLGDLRSDEDCANDDIAAAVDEAIAAVGSIDE